ncbi:MULTISPECIES: SGNH/GDSL hydrolase family protein [pseudomallei group]|uniref:SGNH/GDSL hydrolase family protein n=1 Tax=pseudomallei group TaxID=111527 RepID=UPI001F18BE44|nr:MULTISPECIES: SGNH/GDSL hydrolase family protein [pseudomallei group]MCS6455924.1 SGNH/GDSL hydrolase family protein [Burkholderia thailandensis]MCS6482639.1 SGNH/GDSL hydrolase family protein [Burkholderia thailandensis]MCS6499058.1 SGNH/GDSL hydrolase family protein [Burkholderia thailandensis]WRS69062.1 SGNH/GDSL hydrolase family protein [Burkholderia thailandensis]
MALGCSAALTGCGGGGDGGSQAAAPATLPEPAPSISPSPSKSVKIAMYGDSTAFGTTLQAGTYVQSPHNEPASIQFALQRKYGTAVTVENRGVPGSTCGQWLWGQSDVKQSWTVEMAKSDAQIVTMNCAINDAFLPNETDQDFQYVYGQFAQIARQYGKAFVIITPNPIEDPHNVRLEELVRSQHYVAQLQQVEIIDQWSTIQQAMPNWQANLPDRIHPNDALYEYMAQISSAALDSLVARYLSD